MNRRAKGALEAGLLAYIGLPYLLVQLANLGLIREGKRARHEVALTFDDGPDPATTPAVLDALAAAGAKATFFVLAASAEAQPDLMARMLSEGHQVEAHAALHRHAWIRSLWGAFADPGEAARRIGKVTGQPVRLHRPPHGAYTLATILGQRKAGLTGAHWSIEGHDWHARFTPEQVRERLGRLLVPGAVVVLHDAGPGAQKAVPMLPGLLADLKVRGYKAVRLDALDGAAPQGRADFRRRAFLALDAIFDRLGGVTFAGGRADNLFRIARVPFPLSGVRLQNGQDVPAGVPALEFHVNNPVLVDLGPRASVRQARRDDLRVVARDWQTRMELADAQYIFCLSAVSPLLGLLNFENHDLPPGTARRLQGWANVLRRAYGNDPTAKAPRLSILSRQRFMELYGAATNGDTGT